MPQRRFQGVTGLIRQEPGHMMAIGEGLFHLVETHPQVLCAITADETKRMFKQ